MAVVVPCVEVGDGDGRVRRGECEEEGRGVKHAGFNYVVADSVQRSYVKRNYMLLVCPIVRVQRSSTGQAYSRR